MIQVDFSHVRISQGSAVSSPDLDLITCSNTETMHFIMLEVLLALSLHAKSDLWCNITAASHSAV